MKPSVPDPEVNDLLRSFPLPPGDRKPQVNARHLPFHSQPVLLLVGGPIPSPFYVHEELIVSVSSFFRAALDTRLPAPPAPNDLSISAGFMESITKTVHLPEENPCDIEYFLQWLYLTRCTQRLHLEETTDLTKENDLIPCPFCGEFVTPQPREEECPTSAKVCGHQHALWHRLIDGRLDVASRKHRKYPAFSPLIRLYFLSDRLCIPSSAGLRDHIVDHFHYIAIEANALPGAADVKNIWDHTEKEEKYIKRKGDGSIEMRGRKNRLRQLVLDLYRVLRINQVLMKGLLDSNDITVQPQSQQQQRPPPLHPSRTNEDDPPSSTHGNHSQSDEYEEPAIDDHEKGYPREFLADLVFDCIQYGVRTGKERRKIAYQADTREYVEKRGSEVVSKGWMGMDRVEARCFYHEHRPWNGDGVGEEEEGRGGDDMMDQD